MEREEYRIMYEAEDTHWWYRGLRNSMLTLLKLDRGKSRHILILDAGCGTGGNLQYLKQAGFTNLDGFDFSQHALELCRERGLHHVKIGSITEIPYPDNHYDVVISCDVLNDKGIHDDCIALRELYRVLKPGGLLFLNLPALKLLSGQHDQATSIARRYTRRSISEKLEREGFRLRRVTYRNMLLFPLIFVVRKLRRSSAEGDAPARSDISLPPAPLNAALTLMMKLESLLLRYLDLPIGSSVSVVAQKPRPNNYSRPA